MIYYSMLLTIAVLPVILLMIYIYRQDKYEKEPIGLLMMAFFGGMLAIPLDFVMVYLIGLIVPASDTPTYQAFFQAGIPEELSKFLILMLIIWRNKNFNEYMDGIVYATFLGLGFALVENIGYVFDSEVGGFGTAFMRALLSVPGHFLFAVIMGYFLSLAKFSDRNTGLYLFLSFALAALAHGLFDWLLMVSGYINAYAGGIITIAFIILDVVLWKVAIRYINRHRENSQFKYSSPDDDTQGNSDGFGGYNNNSEPEYKHIDWNAGRRP